MLLAAAVCFVSCKQDNPNDVKPSDSDNGNKKNLSLEIEIDGVFSDWAATDASLYASAETDPDAPWDAVEEIRCCADPDYVYYYIRYNEDALAELMAENDQLPIRLNINTDGEFESGYLSYSLQGYDFIVEGDLSDKAGNWRSMVGSLYQRVNGSWEELVHESDALVVGAGNGAEYEIMLDRGLFSSAAYGSSEPNSSIGDVFQTGIRFYETTIKNPGHWEELSNMPNSADGSGYADLLEVKTVKGK